MASIVFLGTSSFAVPALKALALDKRFIIELVVTQPDRPVGRKQELTPPPVKLAAQELNLKIEQPESLNSEFRILNSAQARPDFLVCIAYGQIISQEVIDWPKIAAVNLHGSLLPLLRGASPVHHAILQGFTETGVTVQRMVKELDAGPTLAQTKTSLSERETFQSLHDTLAEMGAALLTDTLKKPLMETKQDEAKVTLCKKLSREDGIANPKAMTAEAIDRMVRALTPWPGVTINGNKILAASLFETPDSLKVECANTTTLYVQKIQPPSGKLMSGKAFATGRTIGA